MKKMHRITLWAGVVVLAVLTIQACTKARADIPEVAILSAAQQGDSVLVVVGWTAPPAGGPRRAAIAGYETRLVEAVAAIDTVAAGSVLDSAQLVDTLAVPIPALGDSLVVYAALATRDVDGDLSVWSVSPPPPLLILTVKLLPLPPGNVNADTLPGAIAIDTVLVRPEYAEVNAIGQTLQFCAIVVNLDGSTELGDESVGRPTCDTWLQIVRDELAGIPVNQALYLFAAQP